MNKILIGIDCDVEKSGVAIMENSVMSIHKMKFFELYDFLHAFVDRQSYLVREAINGGYPERITKDYIKIYIEAGWLNQKSNWHVSGKGEAVSARVGTKVGANHQVGKLIAEMCEYLGLEYELVQPRTSKMPVKLFRKITGYEGKVDQDMVDATLLIWGR